MGLLLDERVDQKDVTATIIDLAVRGYLSIEEVVVNHPTRAIIGRPISLPPGDVDDEVFSTEDLVAEDPEVVSLVVIERDPEAAVLGQ